MHFDLLSFQNEEKEEELELRILNVKWNLSKKKVKKSKVRKTFKKTGEKAALAVKRNDTSLLS